MKTKNIWVTIIAIIVIFLLIGGIGGGIYYYLGLSKGGIDKVEATSDDGFATLSATFYNFEGDPIKGGVSQALIGGKNQKTHIKFDIKATNTGNVNLTNVRTTTPNANMNGAFDNIAPLPSLLTTDSGVLIGTTSQSCVNGLDSSCNTNEECCNSTSCIKPLSGNTSNFKCFVGLNQYASADANTQKFVPFCISLIGDYFSATGTQDFITSAQVCIPDATGYDIRGEFCSDLTPINTCVFARTGADSHKPKYCNFVEDFLPSIIDKSSDCGCPTGKVASGDSCVNIQCADGTDVGQKSTRFATGCTADGIGAVCKCILDSGSGVLDPGHCNEYGYNTGGCSNDFYGASATGCTTGTDPSQCTYTSYTGNLSGTITE